MTSVTRSKKLGEILGPVMGLNQASIIVNYRARWVVGPHVGRAGIHVFPLYKSVILSLETRATPSA